MNLVFCDVLVHDILDILADTVDAAKNRAEICVAADAAVTLTLVNSCPVSQFLSWLNFC